MCNMNKNFNKIISLKMKVKSLKNPYNYLLKDIKNTLVIRDSLTSDIYPAIQAGYGYVIYLRHNNKKESIKTNKSTKVYQTKDLGSIFS